MELKNSNVKDLLYKVIPIRQLHSFTDLASTVDDRSKEMTRAIRTTLGIISCLYQQLPSKLIKDTRYQLLQSPNLDLSEIVSVFR
jgi:hypothetical protein